MAVRALVIANANDLDSGFVGDRFRSHGYAFTECHRESPGDWPQLDGHELVLLLGSEWSVYWPHIADEVGAEVALVREAHRRGMPLFAICFGAQVVAHALGGSVQRAVEPEVGWYDVDTDAPSAIASGPWLQWHYDSFTAPPGFTELARSPVGPQAIRLGRTFAVQFHPEATESMLVRWTAQGADELVRMGKDPQSVLDDSRRHTAESRPNAGRLVDWFCAEVAGE